MKVINRFKARKLTLAVAASLALGAGELLASDQKILNLDVSRQSIGSALVELSKTSGVQIVLSQELGDKVVLDAIKGEFTLTEALDRMLSGSGLTYEFRSDELVVIDEEGSGSADDGKDVEEVVVTGSRLRGVSPTSPVTTITIEQIKAQGINSVEGIIRSLPQNVATQTSTSAIDASGTGSSLGVAVANLRGLGSDGTLILINGRRSAATPTFTGVTVNLNTIPFDAIERVEVLTDGASSVYGSDAVAGVINFILRKDYDAEETTTVRYDDSENGGNSFTLQQSFGFSWGDGSLNGSVRYQETDPISSAKAGFTSLDLTSRGGGDQRPTRGSPGIYLTPDPLFPWLSTPIGALDPNRDASIPVSDVSEFKSEYISLSDNPYKNLSDKRDSASVYLSLDHALTDTVTSYAELTYAKNKSIADVLIPAGTYTVPVSNAFNDTNMPITIGYSFDGEIDAGLLPYYQNRTKSENRGVVFGIKADLPFNDWKLDSYLNYTVEKSYTNAATGLISQNVSAALADSNPDTALNLFGNGSQQNSETMSMIYGAQGTPITQSNDTKQFSLSADGNVMSLPGGDAKMVLGFDFRRDTQTLKGSSADRVYDSEPHRDVMAVISELNIPIIGDDNALPGVYAFDFRVAARWEEYSIEGPFDGAGSNVEKNYTNTAPTVGFAWYVTPEVKIRATAGESFKVPLLTSLFARDGNPSDGSFMPYFFSLSGIFNDPVTGSPLLGHPTISMGNPDLKPEVSDTLTYGFDWTPSGDLEGLNLSVSYQEIETKDVISSTQLLFLYEPEVYLTNGGPIRDSVTNEIVAYAYQSLNFSKEGMKAVDLNIDYSWNTSIGDFRYGLAGTYTKTSYNQFTEVSEITETLGTLEGPNRVKLRTWLTWSNYNYGATLSANYSDSYKTIRESSVGPDRPVEHYITYDLTGYYNMDDGWRFGGGVRNLTSQSFPFVDNRVPFDPRRVDANGRIIYLEVSKSFDLI